MSRNIKQVFTDNPITSNNALDLMYFGVSPYGLTDDAAMTYANFALQFGAPYTPSALTRTDDTNVTLTLGGTPATALLKATSITAGWSGTLSLARGGLSAALTASNGGIFYSTASAGAILAGTATASLPLLSGSSAAPTWGSFALSLGGALTSAGALTTSGAFGATFTFTNTTTVTFPTSGTLATTSQLPSAAALTKADDTNVTLTLGGTPATALLQATSITAGWTGQLAGSRGGTGVNNSSTITVGGNLNTANSFTTSGNFSVTQTYTGATNVTFPTTGTLATTSQLPSAAALTKSDDTNVTLALGGTPATALLQATSITAGWAGTLSLARGGTAAALTASNGGIFYSTASAGAILAGTATAGQMLRSGSTAAPTWSTATFPATAGTSGNVLTSDGTNFVSSALALPSGTMFNYQATTLTTNVAVAIAGAWTSNISGLTVSITPTSASNKVLVTVVINHSVSSASIYGFRLMRGATPIGINTSVNTATLGTAGGYSGVGGAPVPFTSYTLRFMDTPATTSATTYAVQVFSAATMTLSVNTDFSDPTNSASYVEGISTIDAIEIKA